MSRKSKSTGELDLLEGTPESRERRESLSRKHTNTNPVIQSASKTPAGTGALHPLRMEAEGAEDKSSHRETDTLTSDDPPPGSNPTKNPAPVLAESQPEADAPQILIVEDTQELAEVIQATLESAGMITEAVSRGSKGLEKIKENVPDVLLLDIGLPDMTGWKMLEELRGWQSDDKDKGAPVVIVITAYGDPANRLIGKLQGIHSYLIKPFTSDEVEKVVRNALNEQS